MQPNARPAPAPMTARATPTDPARHGLLWTDPDSPHPAVMPPSPQVAALLVRRLVDVLVSRGAPREALLARAALPRGALATLRLRLPWSHVEDLIEAAEALTGDDRLGLHISRAHDLDTLALPGLLFFASRTLGDAVRRLERVQRLWSDAYRGVVTLDPPRFTFTLHVPERRASVHLREQALADTLAIMRAATGRPVAPTAVHFAHHRGGDLSEYESFFDAPVTFGAPATLMTFAPDVFALPLATASPLFAEHFERQAAAELARLPAGQTLAGRVRALLDDDLAALELATTSLASVAARLRVPARSLQRALAREGTSFAALLDALRREVAEERLTTGEPIAEVSWRLGFSEPAAFHRAFRRWTGQPPDAWRQRGGPGRP